MRVAALLAVAFLLAGCAMGGSTKTVTVTVTKPPTGGGVLGQTAHAQYFGVPVSITRADAKRYLLVLKPEFFLVGVPANVAYAAGQGKSCAPLQCPGVPDDRWVVPAGTANLTFVLPAKTKGTVLTLGHQNEQNTSVTAAQLAAVVGGAKTPKLFEPLDSGVWLAVNGDSVTSFAQQYQP